MTDKKKTRKASSVDEEMIRDLADLLSEPGSPGGGPVADIVKRRMAVNFRLTLAEQVQVRAVQDIDRFGHAAPPGKT